MTLMYEKAVTPREGLRLHLNENTGGCSPAVVEALRSITAVDAASYPDYADAIASCAAFLRVVPETVLLTNGLDEGIFAASITAMRESRDESSPFEAIVTVPSFDMYAGCVNAVGGRVIAVPHESDFSFPRRGVLDAITAGTRLVFITDPHNPTGLSVPRDSIVEIATAAPQAMVFIDEAYADFRGRTLVNDPALDRLPNIVIGRTFAKTHGLAGIRVGALVAPPVTLERLRQSIPPYSINLAAVRALPAALGDTAHTARYVAQSQESRARLYTVFDRLGLQYWPSDANFVLARVGPRAGEIVRRLAARGIYVRDRSKDHGCVGCLRITAGVVEHTDRLIRALEEVL